MRGHSLLLAIAILGAPSAFADVCSKVNEDQVAQLSCPAGQTISTIKFASYGTPTGSCGSFKVSSCNSSTSKSVVKKECIGKNSCQVSALNSLFGDPCSGVFKSLAAQVTCTKASPAPSPTPSPSHSPSPSPSPSHSPSPSPSPTATPKPSPSPTPSPSPKPSPSPSPIPSPSPTVTPLPSVGSNITPPSPISIPATTLALPSSIANGSSASNPTIVSLQCGQVYRGTLDLSYKSYITINVAGTCGKPTIIPSSTSQNGINAVSASNIKISGIKIQGAAQGINVNNATTVSIDGVDILNSANSGIFCSGANGMTVSNSSISNSAVTGVDSLGAINNSTITNTTVYNTSKGSGGAGGVGIYFYNGNNNRIDHVSVSSSAYHGIVSLETTNSYVTNSLSQNSCTGPDKDCGAIYTAQKATPHVGLNLLIDNNKVVTSGGSGIYLDDYANGVTVSNNNITGCSDGMMLHNGYNNNIHNNIISSSVIAHVSMGQDTGTMHDNVFTYNTMNSTNGEYGYRLETGTNLSTFARYDYNTYQSTNVNHFGRLWQGGTSPGIDASYSAWKSTYMLGQDAHSTMNGSN